MSSIFGKLQLNGQPVDRAEISSMETALNHWSADQSNIWQNEQVALGHLMLYNTPESLHEKLPFFCSESQLTITADARIDNRDELIRKLDIKIKKEELPDSLLILRSYEKYGNDCVKHLIGDFAFAIWDERKKQLFCARDHMGVKPFFYYCDDDFLAFASEKKGIMAMEEVDLTIDKQFFYNYIIHPPNQHADTTLYEKIRRLPPASTIILNAQTGENRISRYWTLDVFTEIHESDEGEYYNGLLYHFEEAVRCRLRSVFPAGIELSGGLDSSAITGVAFNLKDISRNLTTISNVMPPDVTGKVLIEAGGREYIDSVIQFNSVEKAIYISQSSLNIENEIKQALFLNDGLDGYNPFWQIPMKAKLKEEGIRTILSGFAGDNMITTAGKNFSKYLLDKKKYGSYFNSKAGINQKIRLAKDLLPPYMHLMGRNLYDFLGLYKPEVRLAARYFAIPGRYKRAYKNIYWKDPVFQEAWNSYRHSQRYSLLNTPVFARLEGENRVGICYRNESRFPMVDIRLIQYFLSIPNHLKFDKEHKRMFFRNAVRKYLPDSVFSHHSKRVASAPYRELKYMEIYKYLMSVIENIKENDFLNKKAVKATLQELMDLEKTDPISVGKKVFFTNRILLFSQLDYNI